MPLERGRSAKAAGCAPEAAARRSCAESEESNESGAGNLAHHVFPSMTLVDLLLGGAFLLNGNNARGFTFCRLNFFWRLPPSSRIHLYVLLGGHLLLGGSFYFYFV